MSNAKDTLINAIVKNGTTPLSFDEIRFYEERGLLKHQGKRPNDTWVWNQSALRALSVEELEFIG